MIAYLIAAKSMGKFYDKMQQALQNVIVNIKQDITPTNLYWLVVLIYY